MAYLLDTNILLRLVQRSSPAHPSVRAAIRHLRAAGEDLHFAPQNAAEFWNVASRPVARNGFGLTPAAVDHMLRLLERLFQILPETPALYPRWRSLVAAAEVSGVQVHDARLVAWMQVHGVTHILTLNPGDFTRYVNTTGIVVVEPGQVLI